MNELRPAPEAIAEDDPRIVAARPHTLDAKELARLELALIGAWPFPYSVTPHEALADRTTLALRNSEGVIFALLDGASPGRLLLVRRPRHADLPELRASPSEVRPRLGSARIVNAYFAEESLDPLLAARLAATLRDENDALVVFVNVAAPRAGDLAHYLRIRALRTAVDLIGGPRRRAVLVLLPPAESLDADELALRDAIASAYGANRIVVDSTGVSAAETQSSVTIAALPSATRPLDGWAAVEALQARARPPRSRQGFTVWFTGLSQAGKSTIATILSRHLLDHGRASTLLDGDVVRTHLSKGLGFSREDRDTNIRRLGYVAGEITRHGGVALVAAISPYRAIRAENRAAIGNYVEVFVNAPIATCESRDQKGQYAKARRGEITGFTGVDDPYEAPRAGDGDVIECLTDRETPTESAQRVFDHLVRLGYVDPGDRIG